jgi:WD40 repeat protein
VCRLPQVWDSQTLQCMKTLEGHEDNVRVLAVGERQVFSGSWDKTIRVWDLDTLECSKVYLRLLPVLVTQAADHCCMRTTG